MKKAVVPGTFDPITLGHIDIITRAAQIFDEVVVGVATSAGKGPKGPLFTLEERVAMARESTAHLPNVEVEPFNELLVVFARRVGASALVKGLRAITDFEYEFQMTAMNYQIDQEIETVFIMSTPQNMYLSSSIVRELAMFNGKFEPFVTPCVYKALCEKYGVPKDDIADSGQ